MKTLDTPLLTLGGGNMAHAIISGARSRGLLQDHLVAALDPNADRHSLFPAGFEDQSEAVAWLTHSSGSRPLILLAVKPQMLCDALPPLIKTLEATGSPPCTFVSILAGTRSESIRSVIRPSDRVLRVMPNTPAQVGQGMSAIANDSNPNPEDLARTRMLFEAIGRVIEIPESLMDAFTAVAGSGPAYLFYLAEGMVRGAQAVGFTPDQASMIVRQTILGSASLLGSSDESPEDLRAKVTSRNGTTYAATTTLDTLGVMSAITDAIAAARDRGVELGRGD